MNAKSFVFDVALPGIFVLGAGVATFMLSGGPEEYPSSEDEKEDQEELLVGESNDPDSELNTQNNENLIPKWAIELTEQTKSLSEEVRLLKEAAQANMKLHQEQFHALFLQRNEENKQSSLIEEQVTLSVVQASQRPWTEDDWKIQLRWNVWRLGSTDIDKLKEGEDAFTELRAVVSDENERLKSADTSEEKDSQLDTACDMLIMYMNNVLKNPSIPRYRRIATTNSMHANGLAKVLGHDALLHAVGFISQSDSKHYIYEWHSLPSAEACSSADKEAAPKEGPRKPDSAELARGLLTEAVTLLTALKKGRSALAELILELMDASAVSSTKGRVEEAVVVSPHQQEALSHSTASMQPAVLAPPTSTPMGDESLVTVVDIPDDEGIDLGAASTAASLDFMQILKKAQQQASGARALKPS